MSVRHFPLTEHGRSRIWLTRFAVLTLSTTLAIHPVSQAQASYCTRDAMLVFDASSSMALPKTGPEPTRIDEARRAMTAVMPDIAALRRIGLMIYGPPHSSRGQRGCDGIGLRFAPRADAAPSITAALAGLVPAGLTPLTASVREAAEMLEHRKTPAIIVVITDGIETCGGQPCELGRQLADQSVDLTVHVIGFRRVRDPLALDGASVEDEAHTRLRCLAQKTGGTYADTDTVDELSAALRERLGCMLVG
ncbi:MAG: VWA domain-containing protein [Pseudomonadota bacterium]